MKEFFKEHIGLTLGIIVAVVFILLMIFNIFNSEGVKNWCAAPLSKLTKGDILIFIIAFGLWCRNEKK